MDGRCERLGDAVRRALHQVWLGPKPPPTEWMHTWRDLNPSFEYRVWREADVNALGLVNRRLYDRLYRARRFDGCSDVVRAEILLREGGIYVDADSRALRTLEGAPFLDRDFFIVRELTAAREYLLNGAFMGAEAGYPILDEYVKALSGVTKLVPTWITTGPVVITDVVARFPDAEILPAWTFFVTTLQGVPVTGGEHYGEHYFSSTNGRELKLGGKGYPTQRTSEGLSILVAFRDDPPGRRTEIWNLIRARLERELPEAEICVGTDDSVPFNKCKALNRAAAQASGTVFLLTDSDTWIDPAQVHEAREFVEARPRRWVKPWNRKVRLDEPTSDAILGEDTSWAGVVPEGAGFENVNSYWASPPVVMTRQAWDSVGGMDERMPGWGSEDAAFAYSLKAFYGKAQVLRGDAIHLWHPRIDQVGRDLWPGQESREANERLHQEYYRASNSAHRMRQLLAERSQALAPTA